MVRTIETRILAALVTFALLAGTGCSVPTQPSASTPAAPATGGVATAAGSELTLVESVTDVMVINGKLGGRITAGNFTVVLPRKAFQGQAVVRLTQPDISKPMVQLEISPASANNFKIPVTLIAHVTPMAPEKQPAAYISWFDPSTGKWVPMPSMVDIQSQTVSCPLSHFSEYAVEVGGKAGW